MSLVAEVDRVFRCPTCGTATPYLTTNVFRPFCGHPCKSGDLGAWSTETFRVQAKEPLAGYSDVQRD